MFEGAKKIKCLNDKCGRLFIQKTYRHRFCSRKCFMRYYRQQLKKTGFPLFICSHCGEVMHLNFDPKKHWEQWINFVCPNCKKPNFPATHYFEETIVIKTSTNLTIKNHLT